ncbi:SPOR domain-containing protein [Urechidicola vernalis]|uniref:SPOR domain-containing protein n=1 Tax=Urechidicola vernalis TaxID=3075600 RepID=A0ABU2Y458_9FLAO|nr:SPOR domain-containing protein [Urechidicola sp. P050]MDT0552961.1 SPOR domain-containing protein [Urechidicola sp. P050]
MKKTTFGFLSFLFFLLIGTSGMAQENTEINDVLRKKAAYNKEHPEANGFKIQLYNGNETQAYRVRSEYQIEFNKKAELIYEAPEWKVRVGNYLTRLEADRALLEIKKEFSGAIVLETEIKM